MYSTKLSNISLAQNTQKTKQHQNNKMLKSNRILYTKNAQYMVQYLLE